MTDVDYSDKELIVIPCCDRKNPGGESSYKNNAKHNVLEILPRKEAAGLIEARRTIAEIKNLPAGRDLGLNIDESEIHYLPAYKRYNGNLYKQISDSSWRKLLETQELDLLIISALYGIIFWDEPIRNYNLMMNGNLRPGRWLNTWWRRRGLPGYIRLVIQNQEYKKVHMLLSIPYKDAISGFRERSLRSIEFPRYDLSKYGSGSTHHRGVKVEEIIRNF
jgi:cytoplasmic iron level regulating protein YaaA (DUF328/UPF0246 family)